MLKLNKYKIILDGNVNIVKLSLLLKWIYKFIESTIKIPKVLLLRLEKLVNTMEKNMQSKCEEMMTSRGGQDPPSQTPNKQRRAGSPVREALWCVTKKPDWAAILLFAHCALSQVGHMAWLCLGVPTWKRLIIVAPVSYCL